MDDADSLSEEQEAHAMMQNIFEKVRNEMNDRDQIEENIKRNVRVLEMVCANCTMKMLAMHTATNTEMVYHSIKNSFTEDILPYCQSLVLAVGDSYHRYYELFRAVMQRIVFLFTFAYYLEHKSLIGRDEVARTIFGENSTAPALLDIEDYLLGVLNMATELVRYALNAFVRGDVEQPFEIAKFISALDINFHVLNLKNDALRRRYDVLKYDAQKAEQIAFDLAIRGFKK